MISLLKSTHGLQRGMLVAGLALVTVFLLLAVFAPWLAPYGFNETRVDGVPFGTQQPPSAEHWWGTNVGGQDVLSRVIYGARTAVVVILLAVVFSLVIGVPLGLLSGFLSGPVDRVLVLVMDALYAFPSLLLAIVVAIVVGGGSSGVVGGVLAAVVGVGLAGVGAVGCFGECWVAVVVGAAGGRHHHQRRHPVAGLRTDPDPAVRAAAVPAGRSPPSSRLPRPSAGARRRGGTDAAAVPLHDCAAQRQARAHPFELRLAVQALEHAKQPAGAGRVKAHAVVLHA